MTRKRKSRVMGLVLAGALILAGAIYTTAAWAAPWGPAAEAPAQTQPAASDAELRAAILDMIEDHMGLTGADAEQWADRMLERMRDRNPDFDYGAMIEQCEERMDDYQAGVDGGGCGGGMMGSGYGRWR